MTGDQWFQLLMAVVPSVVVLIGSVALYIRTKAVEKKLDVNTTITEETKARTDGNTEALNVITRQTNGDLDKIKGEVHGLTKGQEAAKQEVKQEVVDTRHVIAGHLGVLFNTINILLKAQGLPPVRMPVKDPKPGQADEGRTPEPPAGPRFPPPP